MSAMILDFRKAAPVTGEIEAPAAPALPYSFDMSQPLPTGNVQIDACVPMDIAVAMLGMLQDRFHAQTE
jgi:hypothetical protein